MAKNKKSCMCINDIPLEHLAEKFGTPLYVYDVDTLTNNVNIIHRAISYSPMKLHFACMANNNITLLRELNSLSAGIFVCTPGELRIAQIAGFKPNQIVLTGCNFSDSEIRQIVTSGATLIAGSLRQLFEFSKHEGINKLGLRFCLNINLPSETINPSVGIDSRIGLQEKNLQQAIDMVEEMKVVINGIHTYIGTNMLQHTYFLQAIDILLTIAKRLKNLEYVDIGGGFGVPSGLSEEPFNWREFGTAISEKMKRFSKSINRNIELKLEPGRSIIGTAGILLTRVVEVKQQNGLTFIGTDTSMSNFARPYIYDQFHEVLLVEDSNSRPLEQNVFIGGNTVASKDFLAKNITLPAIEKGDLLAIMNTGAYGFSMSSHFCCRLRPAEVMVKGNDVRLIRERETTDSLIKGQSFESEARSFFVESV